MGNILPMIGKGGLALAAMGIISIFLYFFDYNIRLLAWIDVWGDTVGWIIRFALIIVGGSLYFFLGTPEEDES